MFTVLFTSGRSSARRTSSVTPKTTWRITSRVRAFIRSSERNASPGVQLSTSVLASPVTRSWYPRRACPLNAGISSRRARLCWAESRRSSECSPITGPRMALPLPAWKTSGSPAKISLTCSGRLNTTSVRLSGSTRIENTSP